MDHFSVDADPAGALEFAVGQAEKWKARAQLAMALNDELLKACELALATDDPAVWRLMRAAVKKVRAAR